MTAAKQLVQIAFTMVSPVAFRHHRERGGETPSFFLLLGPTPRWEESSPLGPWSPWILEGRSSSEIGSLSLFSSITFLFSGPSPFFKFPEICNSDWDDILRGFLSINYISCGERREATALLGAHYQSGPAGHPPARPGGLWRPWASVSVDSTSQKSHIFQNNSP